MTSLTSLPLRMIPSRPGSYYTFRANAFSLLSSHDRTYGVMVSGIDPQREARVTTMKHVIRQGEYLSGGDNNQTIIGNLLAENLKVGVSDELVLLGQARDRDCQQ